MAVSLPDSTLVGRWMMTTDLLADILVFGGRRQLQGFQNRPSGCRLTVFADLDWLVEPNVACLIAGAILFIEPDMYEDIDNLVKQSPCRRIVVVNDKRGRVPPSLMWASDLAKAVGKILQ